MTVVAFAPNWLGDAVMALPALADLRRHVGDGPPRRRGAPQRRARSSSSCRASTAS